MTGQWQISDNTAQVQKPSLRYNEGNVENGLGTINGAPYTNSWHSTRDPDRPAARVWRDTGLFRRPLRQHRSDRTAATTSALFAVMAGSRSDAPSADKESRPWISIRRSDLYTTSPTS